MQKLNACCRTTDAQAKKLRLAADLLAQHNRWRRVDEDLPMVNTIELGLAIDLVVKHLRAIL